MVVRNLHHSPEKSWGSRINGEGRGEENQGLLIHLVSVTWIYLWTSQIRMSQWSKIRFSFLWKDEWYQRRRDLQGKWILTLKRPWSSNGQIHLANRWVEYIHLVKKSRWDHRSTTTKISQWARKGYYSLGFKLNQKTYISPLSEWHGIWVAVVILL